MGVWYNKAASAIEVMQRNNGVKLALSAVKKRSKSNIFVKFAPTSAS
jgi:hypothetical protein